MMSLTLSPSTHNTLTSSLSRCLALSLSLSLSPAAASTLVHAFVVSRLDYCSAIYEGLPTYRLKFLDRVLRTAARLVGRISWFGRVSGRDVLPTVHCLSRRSVG